MRVCLGTVPEGEGCGVVGFGRKNFEVEGITTEKGIFSPSLQAKMVKSHIFV